MESNDVHTESYGPEQDQAHDAILPVTEPITIIRPETEPVVDAEQIEEPEANEAPTFQETEVQPAKRSNRTALIAIGAGVLVVVGAAAGTIGGFLAGQQHSNDAVPQPSNKDKQTSLPTVSAAPVATSAPTEAPSPAATESDSGNEGFSPTLSPNDLAREVIQRVFIDWRNDGVTPQLTSNADQLGGINRYAQLIPQQDESKFTKNFVDGWQQSSGFKTYVQNIEPLNTHTLGLAYATAKDATPFAWRDEIVSVSGSAGSQSANEIITVNDYNNASDNSAKLADPDLVKENGQLLHFDVRLIREGDVLKISSLQEVAIPQ